MEMRCLCILRFLSVIDEHQCKFDTHTQNSKYFTLESVCSRIECRHPHALILFISTISREVLHFVNVHSYSQSKCLCAKAPRNDILNRDSRLNQVLSLPLSPSYILDRGLWGASHSDHRQENTCLCSESNSLSVTALSRQINLRVHSIVVILGRLVTAWFCNGMAMQVLTDSKTFCTAGFGPSLQVHTAHTVRAMSKCCFGR
jgi:hypothetical protein